MRASHAPKKEPKTCELTSVEKQRHEELSLAYNGGKDCLVLLVLIQACLPALLPPGSSSSTTPSTSSSSEPPFTDPSFAEPARQQVQQLSTGQAAAAAPPSSSPEPLQAIYIAPPDPFPEVEDFVATSTREYNLDLVRYALPMRPALEAYLGDRPAVRAIFMGTRRTDPHSEFLTHFSPTDADWPQFMRINPLIDWHYAEIWTVCCLLLCNTQG